MTELTLQAVAEKLLEEHLLLTALELHAELTEQGTELTCLRDYFSNPANFELAHTPAPLQPSSSFTRSPSQLTLDSVELTQLSESSDKAADERVAVLEHQLREAKNTIQALRSNLTEVTEAGKNLPEQQDAGVEADSIRPHEKRALNFLLYQYLLQHNYTITANTFADQNEDQDFEDWDDVGLNVPRPPELLWLYRHHGHADRMDCFSQTDETMEELVRFVEERKQLEEELQRLQDCIQELQRDSQEKPEVIRIAEPDKQNEITCKDMESASEDLEQSALEGEQEQNLPCDSTEASEEYSHSTFEAMTQTDEGQIIETRSLDLDPNPCHSLDSSFWSDTGQRSLSREFQNALLSECWMGSESPISPEMMAALQNVDGIIQLLSNSLPNIIPNVLLAKREVLVPLLLFTIISHKDAGTRERLLNLLFVLIKRPDREQRDMIIKGLVGIAHLLGGRLVEAEVLPLCWEQIDHKLLERRLLVAEACGALLPYVPSSIRHSLIFSILQQMLEDREVEVRETACRSLALLTSLIDDPDKYHQVWDIVIRVVEDSSELVSSTAISVLLQAFAVWATELGRLRTHLFDTLLCLFKEEAKKLREQDTISWGSNLTLYCRAIRSLLPHILVTTIRSATYPQRIANSQISYGGFPPAASPLQDPVILCGDDEQFGVLLNCFYGLMSDDWFEPWEEYQWITQVLLPSLVETIVFIGVESKPVVDACISLFKDLASYFGEAFTRKQVMKAFESVWQCTTEDLATRVLTKSTGFTQAAVPVYVCAVILSFYNQKDEKMLTDFLSDILKTLALCGSTMESLLSAAVHLCSSGLEPVLLEVAWSALVNPTNTVRQASGHLLSCIVNHSELQRVQNRLMPALITLASDAEELVKLSIIPAFVSIIEKTSQKDTVDKCMMQLHALLDECEQRDQHMLKVALVGALSRAMARTAPRYRDSMVLPRFTAMAHRNNSCSSTTRRQDLAVVLIAAYTSMDFGNVSQEVILAHLSPALKCLLVDVHAVLPEKESVVLAMIKELDAKIEITSAQDVRGKMSKIFTATSPTQPNISNFFKKK